MEIKKIKKSNGLPQAWVVSSKDRGRKSIKNGKVYLSNDENFEIEFFNPLKEPVLADIKLNGKRISSNGLLLKPGQRFYLDCFIDEKKKFIFKTYEIDDSDYESANAILNNGLLEVFFYKESTKQLEGNWLTNLYYPYYKEYYPYYRVYPPYILYNNIDTNMTNSNNHTGLGVNLPTSTDVTYTTNIGINYTNTSSIETGRIEGGKKSKQNFIIDRSDLSDYDAFYISSTIIQILPDSRKPISAFDLAKEKKKEKDSSNNNIIESIKKLYELYESDILTDKEYLDKKKELLSRL